MLLTVNEYGGDAADAQLAAFLVILANMIGQAAIFSVGCKFDRIQPNLVSNFGHFFFIQPIVVLKKGIMEFPEFSLLSGRHGGDCGVDCKFMDAAQRVVFEDNFQGLGIFLKQLLEQRRQPRTILSLKVAEYGNDHRCVYRAQIRRAGRVDLADEIQLQCLDSFVLSTDHKE